MNVRNVYIIYCKCVYVNDEMSHKYNAYKVGSPDFKKKRTQIPISVA